MTAPKIGPLDAVAGTANQAGLEWSRRKVEYVCDCTSGEHTTPPADLPWHPFDPKPHLLARTEITVMGPWEVVT